MAPHETLLRDDPGLEGGEWLFRRDGQVFGPVDSLALAAMLYRGEVDGETAVSPGDGSWSALAQIPAFVVHVKKAEVGLRVEAEVTGSRALRARAQRNRVVAIGVLGALLVAGAGGVAFWFARRAAPGTSALLEDFGAGIRIASVARVGVSRRAAEEDGFEIPTDPSSGAAPVRKKPKAPPAPGAQAAAGASQGSVEGGDLVATSFDPRKIQTVVGREQRNLAPCFRAEAERSPDFRGAVPIEFAIGNDGKVAQLWIDEPRFKQGPLRDCLVRALAGWRFDPFPGQRPTVSLAFGIGR
jgi:hypothetical protein